MILMMTLMSLTYTVASARNYVDSTGDKPKIEYVKVNMPAEIRLYSGDSIQVQIRAINPELMDLIHYDIDENKKFINFWIDGYRYDEILNMNPKDIRIAIVSPQELQVRTNNGLLLTNYPNKKKSAINYEND